MLRFLPIRKCAWDPHRPPKLEQRAPASGDPLSDGPVHSMPLMELNKVKVSYTRSCASFLGLMVRPDAKYPFTAGNGPRSAPGPRKTSYVPLITHFLSFLLLRGTLLFRWFFGAPLSSNSQIRAHPRSHTVCRLRATKHLRPRRGERHLRGGRPSAPPNKKSAM
mgnify:CR=1 FL=1